MITLNLKEKCYLIALFGDVSPAKAKYLFSIGSLPAQAGPLVIQEGYRFVERQMAAAVLNKQRKASLFDG